MYVLTSLPSPPFLSDEAADDWGNTPAGVAAGDSKKVIKSLLAQAKQGKSSLQSGTSPYAPRRTGEPLINSKVEDSPLKAAQTAAKQAAEDAAKSPSKSHKPKKTPTPEGTPLAERLNLSVAQSMVVEGPRLNAAPEHITEHYKTRG